MDIPSECHKKKVLLISCSVQFCKLHLTHMIIIFLSTIWTYFNFQVIFQKPKGVIHHLRGPNFTQFWPPPPSSGQLWTFYMMPILLSRAQVWTLYRPPPSSCPRSYWMTPKNDQKGKILLFFFLKKKYSIDKYTFEFVDFLFHKTNEL